MHQTTALIILDGWGYRESKDNNAIAAAATPTMDGLWRNYPHTLLTCSGKYVGLPDGQMGNSEVGHLNLGAGRVVHQDFSRINSTIKSGSFGNNTVVIDVIEQTIQSKKALHILGLLSPGGIHSHEDHIKFLIELAHKRGLSKIYLHGFLDGRDTPPKSAERTLESFKHLFFENKCGAIASIIGRYYAMDRDQNWDRTQRAYDLITQGLGHVATDPVAALQTAYQQGKCDEFVEPTVILDSGHKPITIEDGDSIVFMNFRADRARALTQAFIDKDFTGFKRERTPKFDKFTTLTQYATHLKTNVIFPPLILKNTLGEYISLQGKKQLRLAETEKYAHVTFFFNGGIEEKWPNEERILVKSPSVATYDLKPEMSAEEVTNQLIEAIKESTYDLIVCNYANPDMVGHTGNFAAATKAVECIDACISRVKEALKKYNGHCLITADHGNIEVMFDHQTAQEHTAHTCQPVPLIYFGERKIQLEKGGSLANVSPTILELMGIQKPEEMTAKSLIKIH